MPGIDPFFKELKAGGLLLAGEKLFLTNFWAGDLTLELELVEFL